MIIVDMLFSSRGSEEVSAKSMLSEHAPWNATRGRHMDPDFHKLLY